MTDSTHQPREAFFRSFPGTFSRCWAPGDDCSEPVIRAHSLQNRGPIDLLARDNHVVSVELRFSADGPELDFGLIGRNKATTFEGLCNKHDREIFSPIESEPLDLDRPAHLFLLAYRAVLRELQVAARVGVMAQKSYIERVEAGVDPKGRPSPMGVFATGRLMAAYDTAMFKAHLDRAYLDGSHDVLDHDVLRFSGCRPSVAASALFSLDELRRGAEPLRVALTILPVSEEETVVILSYLASDAPTARMGLNRVLGSKGALQRYEVSRHLINYCENFVLAPDFYDTWPPEKLEAVRSYFIGTLFRSDLTTESEHFDLFWPVV